MLPYPVRIALIAALGGFLFGFETVVISGAEKTLEHIWSLSSFAQGFTVASSLLGTIFGSLVAAAPAKKYGRKKVLQVIAVFFVIAAIGCASVSAWALFIFFRIIGGIAVGASSVVAPMYISEISPAKLRGRLAGSFQVNIVLGIMIAFLTNFLLKDLGDSAWRWMFGVMLVPAVLFWILLRSIPESPRWLVINGFADSAMPVMKRLGEPDPQGAIVAIQKSLHEQVDGTTGQHKEPLFQQRYSKPILYAVLLAMFNQLSGINAILYYAPRIFEMAGFDKNDSFRQSVYVGAANLFFTLLAMTVIDKFGRKKLLLIGSIGMTIFLGLTAYAFNQGAGGSMVLLYLIGFIAFFAFSQGAVIWVFISEIFPNSVRSQGGSLGSSTHWIMAAIISWTFPVIVEGSKDGGYHSFVFYSIMMFIQLIFVWRVLPETKGKTLEEIQKQLGIA
ncbi:sugar porter family MFS transporter [Flavitalea sp. BT771]|uniref:sugar porter family MFS transporter n=1 Tax=Flavitalea sp. BT771 TaxID=3063329 RepID=UPI0026E12296|nr:sugar porter family MFS transporter [Flavitalea sp. BT771]MDO6430627.1 sugar porter family MFS transporter [Flavitalea sp. BT771]MDV6219233.1 sugar porter family MFS transporter [Flavitalea sp. BT771]